MTPCRRALEVTAVGLGLLWRARIQRLHNTIPRLSRYWSTPHGQPGGLTYVALGDSAALGVGASSPDRGYVALLADRLREQTGQPVQVINLAASGATVHDVLDNQLPRLLTLAADVVTVAVGGNDMFHPDPKRFAVTAQALLSQLPTGAFIADVPYFMHGHWERDADRAARALTQQIRTAGLTPVALHAALQRLGWKAMATHFAADWFHPNDRGHQAWAGAFWHEMSAAVPHRDRLVSDLAEVLAHDIDIP